MPFGFAFLLLTERLVIMRHFVKVELATAAEYLESNRFLGRNPFDVRSIWFCLYF